MPFYTGDALILQGLVERLPGVSEEVLDFSSVGTVTHYEDFLSWIEYNTYYKICFMR